MVSALLPEAGRAKVAERIEGEQRATGKSRLGPWSMGEEGKWGILLLRREVAKSHPKIDREAKNSHFRWA